MTDLPSSALRVQKAATYLGLAIDIVTMAQSTRTAEDAAAACGCTVGQIVKSLVFRTGSGGRPILLLVSGSNRVDESLVSRTIGDELMRPDAGFVRERTGFAIGGIPPFGHDEHLDSYMDRDLLDHATVWAAAGTPRTVFAISSRALRDATAALVIAVR